MTTFRATPPRWGWVLVAVFGLSQLWLLISNLRDGSTVGAVPAGVAVAIAAICAFAMARWRAVVTTEEVRLEGPGIARSVRWADVEQVRIDIGALRRVGRVAFIPSEGKKVIVPAVWRVVGRDADVVDLAAQAAQDAGVEVNQGSKAGAVRMLLVVGLLAAGVIVGLAFGGGLGS